MNPTIGDYPGAPSMDANERFVSMTDAERAIASQAITDEQYQSLQNGMFRPAAEPHWKPGNDEEWIAVWCRNSRLTGFESAKQTGSLPLYIFTLPTKPIEMLFYAAAKRWPSDSWEGLGYALFPVLVVGSGFLWYKLFQWIRGN